MIGDNEKLKKVKTGRPPKYEEGKKGTTISLTPTARAWIEAQVLKTGTGSISNLFEVVTRCGTITIDPEKHEQLKSVTN